MSRHCREDGRASPVNKQNMYRYLLYVSVEAQVCNLKFSIFGIKSNATDKSRNKQDSAKNKPRA